MEPLGEAPGTEGALDVQVDPANGVVPPGGSAQINFCFIPEAACAGGYSAYIVCDVEGARKPIGFAVSADIRGLSVSYKVRRCKLDPSLKASGFKV